MIWSGKQRAEGMLGLRDTDKEKGQNLTYKPGSTARRQPVRQCGRVGGWEEGVEGGREDPGRGRREGPL